MRWRGRSLGLLVAAGAIFLGSGASAQTVVPSSAVELEDAEIFRPTTDASDYVTVYDSDTLPQRFFYLGFWGDYARNPIEVQFEDSGDLFTRVVKNLGTVQLVGSFGLLDRWEIGVRVPGYIESLNDIQFGGDTVGGTTGSIGDVVLNTKFSLLQRGESGLGIAVLPELILPTGDKDKFAGTGKLGGGGLLVLDWYPTDAVRFSINGGGYIRDKIGGGPLKKDGDDFNDQLRYGAGLAADFSEAMTGIVEVYGGADVSDPFSEERKTPLDAIGALRFHLSKIDLTFGGGAGLTRGQGSPDFRVFFGITPPKPRREVKEGARGVDLSQSRKTYALEDKNGDGRPSPGDTLLYQVQIVNVGTDPANNVVVEDPIPARSAYVPGSITINGQPMTDSAGDDGAEAVSSPVPGIVARITRLGTAPEDNHAELAFRVTIDTEITSPTPITNQATVSADNVPAFPLPPAQTMVFPAVPQHEHVIVGPEKLELTEEIHFEFDKAVIQKDSYPILKELGQVLKEYPDLRIRIEGNTDSVGSDEYNQKLSDRRSKSVRDFLIGLGIQGSRLETIGKGEGNPIASNDTAAGRAMNRRTEFIVLNPEAVKNAVLQPERSKEDLAPQSEPAWLKNSKGTPPR